MSQVIRSAMPLLRCNGQLAWAEHGKGQTVLLLHSLGAAGAMWATTVAALAGCYRVLTLDARGHGDSPAEGDISVEQYATDALALLDHIGSDAIVAGLSMGGQAALHMAARAPQRIKGIILADTSLGARRSAAERMAQTSARIAELGIERFAEDYARNRLMPETAEAVVQSFSALVVKTLPDTYVRQSGSIARQDLRAVVTAIRAPALVLVGSHDVSTPPSVAEELRQAIPGATMSIISKASHLSNLDQPEAFNTAVIGFLERSG